jgi:5-methylcytosine-specific restriction protein B
MDALAIARDLAKFDAKALATLIKRNLRELRDQGAPSIPAALYNQLVVALRLRDPSSPVLSEVGEGELKPKQAAGGSRLDDDELLRAWLRFNDFGEEQPWHRQWRAGYLARLDAIRSAENLGTPEIQARLWADRSVTPLGPGDSIDVTALYEDPEVVLPIVGLRAQEWPDKADARAHKIQHSFDQLLEVIASKPVRVKPAAKLKRIFATLLPRDLCCTISLESNRRAADLLLGHHSGGQLALQVLMRDRIRVLLGPERNSQDDVDRSTFCWWLYEQYTPLQEGYPHAPAVTISVKTPDEVEPIEIWPFAKQYKGLSAIRGQADFYRAVVQASVAQVSRDDIVEQLRETEYGGLQPNSIRHQIILIKGLGFVQEENELVSPTPAGEDLLQDEEPDVLVEALVVRVFGFAQLIRMLSEGEMSSDEVIARLQAIYPNWTTPRSPTDLLSWSRAASLTSVDPEKRWSLTEYGREWVRRLPPRLPTPPAAKPTPDPPIGSQTNGPEAPAASFPTFDAIRSRMRELADTRELVFDSQQLAAFDAAWRFNAKKRFVILTGLSGTGKTALARGYAHAVCSLMGILPERHARIVPVLPDWHDPTGLLGYYNALHADPTFRVESALRLLLDADKDPGHPYFLILDEMNLARVERYFAPMLSAMETGDSLVIHANEGPVNEVPPQIKWPRNLYVAGTVTMDETTHSISDKVLDRAFTLEFWQVNLAEFFARRAEAGCPVDPMVQTCLLDLYEILAPVRRHFGYRTAGEVIDYVATLAPACSVSQALDIAVFAKILPKLRGEESPAFSQALLGAAKRCTQDSLSRSAAKLDAMLELLRHTGVTTFYG